MYTFDKVLKNNPLFQNESFTKREAFLWLLNNSIDGHISITTKTLSLKWSWHVSKVKRFLSRLQEELLIIKTIKSGKLFLEIKNSQNDLQHTFKNNLSGHNRTNNRLATSIENTSVSKIRELDANQECIDNDYFLGEKTTNRLDASMKNSVLSANSEPETDQDLSDCKKQEKKKRTKKRKEINTKEKYIPLGDIQKENKFADRADEKLLSSNDSRQEHKTHTNTKSSKGRNTILQVDIADIESWAKETLPIEINISWELAKFHDYWMSCSRKLPKNGSAAFRNWLRRIAENEINNRGKNERLSFKNPKPQSTDFERFLTGGARALDEIGRN
jgi:hypothetical protein